MSDTTATTHPLSPTIKTCTAISPSTQTPCPTPASTPKPPFFCPFHKKQCQTLHLGYKRRLSELETLEKSPPPLLLPRDGDYGNVNDTQVLKGVHEYLLKKLGLVTRCVVAREIQMAVFFKERDREECVTQQLALVRKKAALVTMLERVEKRLWGIRYRQEQWFGWVKKLQEEEGGGKKRGREGEKRFQAAVMALEGREKEKEVVGDPVEGMVREIRQAYVKLVKAMCNPATDMEKKEGEVGAEEYLKAVLEQRKRRGSKDGFGTFSEADPIMKAMGDGLKRMFNPDGILEAEKDNTLTPKRMQEESTEIRKLKKKEPGGSVMSMGKKTVTVKKGSLRGKKTKGKQKNDSDKAQEEEAGEEWYNEEQDLQDMLQALNTSQLQNVDPSRVVIMPDISRLTMKDGKWVKKDPDEDEDEEIKNAPDRDILRGIRQLRDFIDDIKPRYYDADYPQEEDIYKAQQKFAEQSRAIREYQLLRNILRNSSLLSVAIECNSIDELLNDTEKVRNSDLRDLALGLSKTTMQDIRSACSDYWLNEVGVDTITKRRRFSNKSKRKQREEDDEEEEEESAGLDRIKVCGRWIHNYPMESRHPRRGWFQFGLLTFASWETALSLCTSWDECYELSLLGLSGYFNNLPQDWIGHSEPYILREARRIGFLTYARSGRADIATKQSPLPFGYKEAQARNYICGNMSRNDPRARRFIAMCNATTSELCIWVKDMRTRKIVYQPPAAELWITRTRVVSGAGGEETEWEVQQAMNGKFREQVQATRPWNLGFSDYLEVHIWDRHEGRKVGTLVNVIMKLLNKAYFHIDRLSMWESTLDVVQRIAIEEGGENGENAHRAREIRKNLKGLRKREDMKKMLLDPDPGFYYDDIDEYIDRKLRPWKDKIWWEIDGDDYKETREFRKALDEVSDSVAEINDADKMVVALKKAVDKVCEGEAMAGRPRDDDNEDVGSDDAVSEKSGYSREWSDVEKPTLKVGIWGEAVLQAERLEDISEKLATGLFDMLNPGFNQEKYERDREAMSRLIVESMNTNLTAQDRARNERKQKKISERTPLPQNFWFCNNMVQMIWSKKFHDIDMREMWEENAPDTKWDDFPLLRDNDKRANNLPRRRSNSMPEKVKNDWDNHIKEHKLMDNNWAGLQDGESHMSREEVRFLMGRIMTLWKQGAISPSYNLACMPVLVGKESPDDGYSMYIDYDALTGMFEPRTYTAEGVVIVPTGPTSYLKETMEKWERKYPNSWYALCKLKSMPEHWLMPLPEDVKPMSTFLDPRGRIWEWNKTPKDFPYAGKDLHTMMRTLMIEAPRNAGIGVDQVPQEENEDSISHYVSVREDVYLVCGRTEKEAKSWTEKAASYFRKKPRGFEVDWARSFLAVRAEWLRALPERAWL
ncbi:hypothetical protein BDD12DRAFT_880249 [Trichophaea hybrida]|nr:hypothetical protein BDD12DRAFT_880249 [Trichophaea hybrida]